MAKSHNNKEIAGRLKELRLNLKYTQEQFAEFLDISVQLYKKMESGENNISIATLHKMKKKLRFSVDYLLFGEKDDQESIWNRVIALDDSDKEKLLLRLFVMMTSDDRRVSAKSREEHLFQMLDQVREAVPKDNPHTKTTKRTKNKR
ncbi:MAG: helix-turn-helix domain-containing protein [Lachnospiraceae bacterium]|nr:helix-turn-helix domain-containing protein [Lachnospiraceae bacterium]MDE6742836.1 helix-turn-helix domain-containing protein [Lachnospiraceae bacterium]